MEETLIKWRTLYFNQSAERKMSQSRWKKRSNVLDPDTTLEDILDGDYMFMDMDASEGI